jgi:hypothetical protein
MIIGYFGNVRQGKTLSAVRELKKLYDKGYRIYSNTWLSFPHKPLTLDYVLDIVEKDLDVPDNSVFFIDEIYIWADSRMSTSKRNRVISYFLLQTGKLGKNTDYGLLLLFTAQYPDQIDKRLKHVMDMGVQCRKIEYRGKKYFLQTVYVYKGDQSFNFQRVFAGDGKLYELYDTRKKIRVEKDRYEEED